MATLHYHGLLVLDKPGGMTSRDVVNRAQRWFPRGTKLGHTGTLDPLATGVLVLCVGAATRLAEYVQQMGKVYRAGVRLGARSDTDDADGTITPAAGAVPPDRVALESVLSTFVGKIDQVPPAYSAIKVEGRRAHDLARRGEGVSLQARPVDIYGIDVLSYDYPDLQLEVSCGAGTYIRSLARDLGEWLGCGALVETLRRTRVGRFEETAAVSLDVDADAARAALLPLADAVVGLPFVTLAEREVTRLRRGQSIPLGRVTAVSAPAPEEEQSVAVFDGKRRLVAIAVLEAGTQLLRPEKVLPAD